MEINIFPISALPAQVQTILCHMSEHHGLSLNHLGASALAAVSAVIGNEVKLVFRHDWRPVKANLYVALVGERGSGKTPAMNFTMAPILNRNTKAIAAYKQAVRDFRTRERQGQLAENEKFPSSEQIVCSDATTEAVARLHERNGHGILICQDELNALFTSANQYKHGGCDEEFWLSAWSGTELFINRASEDDVPLIPDSFISILGGIQPSVLRRAMQGRRIENGYMDRFIYSLDDKAGMPMLWEADSDTTSYSLKWAEVVDHLYDIVQDNPFRLLHLCDTAMSIIISAQNAEEINSMEGDYIHILRKVEVCLLRFLVIMHLLRESCGEIDVTDEIDDLDARHAVDLFNYFFASSKSIYDEIVSDGEDRKPMYRLLGQLDDEFSTKTAILLGQKMGISRATVFNYLNDMLQIKAIKRIKGGIYRKVTT